MARVKNERKDFLMKICSMMGMFSLLPLVILIIVFLDLLFQNNEHRQIAVVVLESGNWNYYNVEFMLNGVRQKQKIQTTKKLKKGDQLRVWISNDDPTTIQLEKPSNDVMRAIYIRVLIISVIFVFINIVLYIYAPSMVCLLFIFNLLLFIISIVKTRRN